jgi:hypothetical protein
MTIGMICVQTQWRWLQLLLAAAQAAVICDLKLQAIKVTICKITFALLRSHSHLMGHIPHSDITILVIPHTPGEHHSWEISHNGLQA